MRSCDLLTLEHFLRSEHIAIFARLLEQRKLESFLIWGTSSMSYFLSCCSISCWAGALQSCTIKPLTDHFAPPLTQFALKGAHCWIDLLLYLIVGSLIDSANMLAIAQSSACLESLSFLCPHLPPLTHILKLSISILFTLTLNRSHSFTLSSLSNQIYEP